MKRKKKERKVEDEMEIKKKKVIISREFKMKKRSWRRREKGEKD